MGQGVHRFLDSLLDAMRDVVLAEVGHGSEASTNTGQRNTGACRLRRSAESAPRSHAPWGGSDRARAASAFGSLGPTQPPVLPHVNHSHPAAECLAQA